MEHEAMDTEAESTAVEECNAYIVRLGLAIEGLRSDIPDDARFDGPELHFDAKTVQVASLAPHQAIVNIWQSTKHQNYQYSLDCAGEGTLAVKPLDTDSTESNVPKEDIGLGNWREAYRTLLRYEATFQRLSE